MQILHLVGRSHRRGAEQVAVELAGELDGLGHRNRLLAVSLGHEGDRVDELPPLAETVRQRPAALLRAALELRRDLRARPVEVVLAHGAAAALVAVLASPRRGPVIVLQTIVGMADSSFRPVQASAWRLAVRRIDGVVALTADLGDELRRLGYRGPVEEIPNGRRTERFEGLDLVEAAAALRTEVGVGPGAALVGMVGFLVEQKQPQRAVDVLAGVRAAGIDAHLVLAGSGPLAGDVEERARKLDVVGHVSLLGHREDAERVLAGLDLLVMTSLDEGVPGVLIEAAMAGCPVVTFPTGGVGEVVEDQVTGVVLGEGTVEAMVAAVVDLLGDEPRRRSMGEVARARSGRWAMDRIALRYDGLLRRLAARG